MERSWESSAVQIGEQSRAAAEKRCEGSGRLGATGGSGGAETGSHRQGLGRGAESNPAQLPDWGVQAAAQMLTPSNRQLLQGGGTPEGSIWCTGARAEGRQEVLMKPRAGYYNPVPGWEETGASLWDGFFLGGVSRKSFPSPHPAPVPLPLLALP